MSAPLQFLVSGLSFAARAVLATITVLTYEYQHDEISISAVKQTLGLSDDAWDSAYDELYGNELVFRCGWPTANKVCLVSANEILSQAIGPGGRPSARDWANLRDRAIEEHGERCFYCRTEVGPFAVDHVRPVSRGGSNHISNLVPACRSCNCSKGNKTWNEWRPFWALSAK